MSDNTQNQSDYLNGIANQTPTDPQTIYAQALNQYFNANYSTIAQEVKLKTITELKQWVSRVFTYQFDFKNIKFDNLNEEQNNYIEEFNFYNSMNIKHMIATNVKTNLGRSAISLRIGKKLIPEVLEIIGQPKYENGELKELYATKNKITLANEVNEITWYRFVKEDGKVAVETYKSKYTETFKDEPLILVNERQNIYKYENIDYIPVQIFTANEESKPEWTYVSNSIDLAGHFTHALVVEWNYIRTQLINNMNFNPDYDAEQMQDRIEKLNKRIHGVYDPDGSLQQALSYLSSGGITTDIARGIIEHFKDEIKEKIFMLSRVAGSNNKHTSEAMSDNINAFNYIWIRKNILSEELAKFYFMILDISKKYGYALIGTLPKYLQGIVQLVRPLEVLMNLNADSEEMEGQATTTFIQKNEEIDKGSK